MIEMLWEGRFGRVAGCCAYAQQPAKLEMRTSGRPRHLTGCGAVARVILGQALCA